MAEEGIRAIAAGVPGAVQRPDDLDARADALRRLSRRARVAVARSGVHHKVCHVLGGAYDLPHADLHTVVLRHVVAFLEPALPGAMGRVARALGAESAVVGGTRWRSALRRCCATSGCVSTTSRKPSL
jgi:maleylacetate reductase